MVCLNKEKLTWNCHILRDKKSRTRDITEAVLVKIPLDILVYLKEHVQLVKCIWWTKT